MGKSRKKVCAGTNCCCKSQKKGKQIASRRFRRKEHLMIEHRMFDSLPRRSIEVTCPWDLGGDGKSVYSWNPHNPFYAKWIRK